jgi:hypothetical protein
MSKKIILTTKIKRENTKLYYCGTSDDGFITVGESEMARGGRPHKVKKK